MTIQLHFLVIGQLFAVFLLSFVNYDFSNLIDFKRNVFLVFVFWFVGMYLSRIIVFPKLRRTQKSKGKYFYTKEISYISINKKKSMIFVKLPSIILLLNLKIYWGWGKMLTFLLLCPWFFFWLHITWSISSN